MNEHELSQYDGIALKHNAAYAAFRTIYEAKLPPPQMPQIERESIFVPIALVVMIVASVIVSGSRTIIEFGGGLVGVSAFVMLEGAIVAYAFFHTRTDFQESRIADVRRLAKIGLVLAFAVAVAANIHAVLKERGVDVDGRVNTAILIAVAISAPSLAFISGDIMALETMRNSYKARKVKDAHAAALTAWMDGLNAAWAREKGKWGVKVEVSRADSQQTDSHLLSGVSVLSVSEQTDNGQTAHSGYGHTRTPDGQAKVIEYLNINPDHAKMPSRELAKLIGVGHDTANKGRNTWRNQQVNVQDEGGE